MDQQTYETAMKLYEDVFRPALSLPIHTLHSFTELTAKFSKIEVDTETFETTPGSQEQLVREFVNAQDAPQNVHYETTITKRTTATVDITNTVTTTNEMKVGISLKGGGFTGSASLINRIQVVASKKDTTTETNEVTEKLPEDYRIDAQSRLVVRITSKTSARKYLCTGTAVVDLGFDITYTDRNGVRGRDTFFLRDQVPEPLKRTVPIKGFLIYEDFKETETEFHSEKLAADDEKHSRIVDRRSRAMLGTPGVYTRRLSRAEAGRSRKWSSATISRTAREELSLRLENDGVEDVYVWVWDNNTSTSEEIVSGERINEGETIDVTVQADGDGNGRISWLSQSVDESDKEKSDSDISVEDGETVNVSLFGA